MRKMLIIGGSDAGISAALPIKEMDPQADVTMVLADAYPNFSICGLPFYISGEVPDWRLLAHRNIDAMAFRGIRFKWLQCIGVRKLVRVASINGPI